MASQYTDGLLRIGGRVGVFLESQTYYNAPNTTQSTYVLVQNDDGIIRRNTWENLKAWILQGVAGGSGTGPTGPQGPPGPPGASDNMGDHSATRTLQMNNFGIENANYIRFNRSGTTTGYIGFSNENIDYVSQNGADHYFAPADNGASGNVGIGKVVPSAAIQLYVKKNVSSNDAEMVLENNLGNVKAFKVNDFGDLVISNTINTVSGNTNITHKFGVNGVSYQGSGETTWRSLSDERVKRDIKDFKDGLNVLMQIRPVTFKYNKPFFGDVDKNRIGVIAQEIEKIAPYTVTINAGGDNFGTGLSDLRSYNPESLTYVLINSIKEQQAIIEKLKASEVLDKAEMKDLKASIAEMKAQIKVLMNK